MYQNKKDKNIVENRGDNYEYIGSYHKNEITLDGKNKKYNNVYIRVKCPYCEKEYDVSYQTFKNGANCTNCCNKYENSFAYYIQVELGRGLNEFWDWEKNTVNPYHIYKCCSQIVNLKCIQKNYHNNYPIKVARFYNGDRCPYCTTRRGKVHPKDSFAQWGIDTFGDDFLEKYWSDKNTLNPFELAPQSSKKIWILCQNKKYHNNEGGYEITCANFYNNYRCSFCGNHKTHHKDSFGYLYPEKAKYWSENNNKTPYEVAPHTHHKYKFICEDCGGEFERHLNNITNREDSLKCHNCTSSKGEQKINKFLTKNNINFIPQKTYKELIGINNGYLSYDFYLPKYNLLIEFQGIQHEEWQKSWVTYEDFEKQQEHDRRKREYAKNHNIELLEIWYWDFDNIENILSNKLSLNFKK